MNPQDNIGVSESIGLDISIGRILSQSVALVANSSYEISFKLSVNGSVAIRVGIDYYYKITNSALGVTTATFNHGAGTQNYLLSLDTLHDTTLVLIEAISLKKISTEALDINNPVKEFLSGTSDEGQPIFFRVDTPALQLQTDPELYSTPIALATETERGSMLKAFVSIDDKPFYKLEGTVTKGVSIIKPHASSDEEGKPTLAQTIEISYRDSSKQLCRITQAAVITTPTTIDYSP